MRYLLIAIYEKTALLGSIILIAYRIFLPYIYKIPYLSVIQCTDNILNFLGDYINRRNDELFISLYTDS